MVWHDPFDEVRRLQKEMNRIFNNFADLTKSFEFEPTKTFVDFKTPLTDIEDKGDYLLVRFEIPGVNKEDIDLNVSEDSITVKVERKDKILEKKEGFFRVERSYKGFYRSLNLPVKVIPNQAKATYRNGILEVSIPKAEKKEKANKIHIE
ncbi:MAG: Hsp20/alpha crystallin family protein [Candidatus Aenigmarchaeota archaeon]|nr:Hsp20/alpha crystallin family protein [Candidatus Aenigmarchaeota archaeon]